MELLYPVLTVIHLLAAVAWLGGMIFHIVVLDPVFRKNEVTFRSAVLLALMERRFRTLVGASIAALVGSGAGKAYLLLGSWGGVWTTTGRYILVKILLTALMLVIFAICPKTTSCSSIPGVCDIASEALRSGKTDGTIRERSKVILPKVALVLGTAALVAAVVARL